MGLFGIVLLVLFAIVCVLLIFMVIIQDQEGEGLGGVFAGAGNAAFGSRSPNIIVKVTYVLGGLFFVLAFSLAIINRGSLGNVEAAAAKKNAVSSEWWNTKTQAPSETLPGIVPELTPPQDGVVPAPATTGSGK